MQKSLFVVNKADSVMAYAFTPDCSDPNGKLEAAILHTISGAKFELFIKYQYGAALPVPTVLLRQTIVDEINKQIPLGSGIKSDYLEFSWDTTSHAITVNGRLGTPAPGPHDVDYSICLFQGIDLLDNQPDSFTFFKALDKDGNNTVVFSSLKGADTKNFYDVSNDLP